MKPSNDLLEPTKHHRFLVKMRIRFDFFCLTMRCHQRVFQFLSYRSCLSWRGRRAKTSAIACSTTEMDGSLLSVSAGAKQWSTFFVSTACVATATATGSGFVQPDAASPTVALTAAVVALIVAHFASGDRGGGALVHGRRGEC